MILKLEERNFANKQNKLENQNWWLADQLASYKHDQGVEQGSAEKQL